MRHKIEFDEKCKSCKGTGIYSGMGESSNCGVVCYTCNGTGCHHFVYEYEDFGGMSYNDWLNGKPFVPGMENRSFTCPAWWYQSANYKLKPEWDDSHRECIWGRSFSQCKHFREKNGCWERWDKEHPEGGNKT